MKHLLLAVGLVLLSALVEQFLVHFHEELQCVVYQSVDRSVPKQNMMVISIVSHREINLLSKYNSLRHVFRSLNKFNKLRIF